MAPAAPSDAPHELSDFTVEHLVEPPKPMTLAERARPFYFAFILNAAFFLFLFASLALMPPAPEKKKEPPQVDLVQEKDAPPPPKITQQPPQPKEEPKPQPKPEPEKPKPYEFKGSGDVKKDKAGHAPVVKSDDTKAKPEKKAEKPKPEAPKQDEANIPDWAKTQTNGYDIPKPKASSRRVDQGNQAEQYADKMNGDGGGDEYSNKVSAQINNHTNISPVLMQQISRSTIVSYILDRRGALRGVRLVQSSGNKDFDIQVLQGIISAAPFPAFPAGAPDMVSYNWIYPEKSVAP
ncbi:MAG: TonB family protein [Parvibaculaceae bacterium]